MRFRQGVGAVVLNRILGGDDQEWLRERIRVGVHRDLPFIHGFEQRRLCLRRGAIDFVRKQDVGEDGAAFEFEFLLDGRINRNAQHIGGQHVASELNALEAAIDGAGQRLAERGLADSRGTFDQQVALRENGNQSQPQNVILAANDSA